MPASCPAHVLVMEDELFSRQKHTETKGEKVPFLLANDMWAQYSLPRKYLKFLKVLDARLGAFLLPL